MVSEAAVVVKLSSILGPVDITHHARLSNPVRPLLGAEVKEQQLRRVQVKRRQMPAIGLPSRAEKILRTRDSRDPMSDEVEDRDRLSFGTRGPISPKGDPLAFRGPGRVQLGLVFREHLLRSTA